MINPGLFSSNTPEWATPKAFFKELDAEFHFNLDPCATPENAKCERFFTQKDNGLAQDWGGVEYSAILHTGGKSPNGCGNAMRNHSSRTPWL